MPIQAGQKPEFTFLLSFIDGRFKNVPAADINEKDVAAEIDHTIDDVQSVESALYLAKVANDFGDSELVKKALQKAYAHCTGVTHKTQVFKLAAELNWISLFKAQ